MSWRDRFANKKLLSGLKLLLPMCVSVGLLVGLKLWGPQYLDQQRLSGLLRPLGHWAPLAFILLLGVRPVTLLPGQLFAAVGGILFGTLLGTVYALVGSVLSTAIVYQLAHRWGRGPMKRLVGHRHAGLENAARHNSFLVGLFACTNMVIPADVVLAMASASRAKFWPLAMGAVVGSLPGTLLTAFFGSSLSQGKTWTTMASVAGLVVSLVTGLFLGRRLVRDFRAGEQAEPSRDPAPALPPPGRAPMVGLPGQVSL